MMGDLLQIEGRKESQSFQMRKWFVSYVEMANPSIYVYMHIMYFQLYKKLQVIRGKKCGIGFLIYLYIYSLLLLLIWYHKMLPVSCLFWFFHYPLNSVLPLFLLSCNVCIYLSICSFIPFCVLGERRLWLESGLGFFNRKWGKCFVKNI